MKFEIEFKFICGKNWPSLVFAEEISVIESSIDQYTKRVNIKIDTLDSKLTFTNSNKSNADTIVEYGKIVRDQSVEIVHIWADNILLNLNLVEQYINFDPVYHDSFLKYCADHNIPVDYHPYPFRIYHNGQWSFNFETPFWTWYADLRTRDISKNFSEYEIELYFGSDSKERQDSLAKLKNLLNV